MQPANVATPDAAFFGFAVQVSTAPAGVVSARATAAVLLVTVFPPASRTVTLGWVAKLVLATAVTDGWVVNWSWAAGPVVMAIEALTAAVSDPDRAVSL